jgi:hypothetical protein
LLGVWRLQGGRNGGGDVFGVRRNLDPVLAVSHEQHSDFVRFEHSINIVIFEKIKSSHPDTSRSQLSQMLAGAVFCFISIPIAMLTSFFVLKETSTNEPEVAYKVVAVVDFLKCRLISFRLLSSDNG